MQQSVESGENVQMLVCNCVCVLVTSIFVGTNFGLKTLNNKVKVLCSSVRFGFRVKVRVNKWKQNVLWVTSYFNIHISINNLNFSTKQ